MLKLPLHYKHNNISIMGIKNGLPPTIWDETVRGTTQIAYKKAT